jgi:CheY-like chemotaxis protein
VNDIVAIVADLFFQSRISAAARAANRQVTFPTDIEKIDSFRLALVDLDAPEGIEAIAVLKAQVGSPVIAFGPHLDTERRKLARLAGADRVLAKSKFVADLPKLMALSSQEQAAGA